MDELWVEIDGLKEENKRMREELSAIGEQRESAETEPLYDTLDDEGNIVEEPPSSRNARITFSAKRETVNIRSDKDGQGPNHNNLIRREKLYVSLHILQFLFVISAVSAILYTNLMQIPNLRNEIDWLQTIAANKTEALKES